MMDVFARCFKKVAAQVCTVYDYVIYAKEKKTKMLGVACSIFAHA